jgi:hypothetical protein
MARGKSGRVVIEIDHKITRQLYISLEYNQKTMKDWFVKEAEELIYGDKQSSLVEDPDNKSKNKE